MSNADEIPLDPSSDQEAADGADEAASMAAMMGFTSFGSQAPPSKKRRYNPRADASFGAAPPLPRPVAGTGANTLPLMPRSAAAAGTAAGAAGKDGGGAKVDGTKREDGGEIDLGLDDDDDDDGDDGGVPAPDPEHVDASRSPARTGGVGRLHSLPAKPPQQTRGGAGYGGQQSGGGQGKRIWWTGYYDPSSNENPWERLEQATGLGPVGSWLATGHGRAQAAS